MNVSRKNYFQSILNICLVFFSCSVIGFSQSITITSPTSDSDFIIHDIIAVTWDLPNYTGNVSIELYKNNTLISTLASGTVNDGVQTVQLPDLIAGIDYRIRIFTRTIPIIESYSDFFRVLRGRNNLTFDLTSPNGGETYDSGQDIEVTWNSDNADFVRLSLYKGDVFDQVLEGNTADDGTQMVTLPTVFSTGSDYNIRMRDNSGFLQDQTGFFTITASDFIQVLSPTTNDSYFRNSPLPITWNSNLTGDLNIDLYQNNSFVSTLASSTPNDSNETIIISDSIAEGSNYTVRISSATDPSIESISSSFNIISAIATIDLPDLIIDNVGVGSISGDIFTVTGIELTNIGAKTTSAPSYSVGFYVSTDQIITFSDFRIGTIGNFSNTLVGGVESVTASFDISSLDIPEGEYYVGIIVDEFDDETEDIETNNIAALLSPTFTKSNDNGGAATCTNIQSEAAVNGFEDGLGLWSQSPFDDISWTVQNGPTASSLTGPSAASEGNYYIYVEASNGNRNKNAIVSSNCIDLSDTNNPRLTFDYHMYGSSTGTLQTNIIDESGQQSTVFIQSGDQGDVWNSTSVNLSAFIGQTIIVEMEATVGISYRSDIAIDNISIMDTEECSLVGSPCEDGDACTTGETYDVNCNCVGGTFTDQDQDGICIGEDIDDADPCLPIAGDACISCASSVSGDFFDGFENGLDQWSPNIANQNNWVVRQGNTPSAKTGPTGAAENSTYIYVEASHGGFPFKKATLNSPCIDLTTIDNPTLSFYYSMYGSSMGSINIFVRDMNSGTSTLVFTQSGNQGQDWRTADIDLSTYGDNTIQLQIEAITGFGFRSDIAIDGVHVHNGSNSLDNNQETELRNFVELASANISQDIEIEEINIFPIPATQFFYVEFETSKETEHANLNLINTNGQVVKQEVITVRNGFVEQKIDITDVATGTYFVSLQTDTSRSTRQVFIKK